MRISISGLFLCILFGSFLNLNAQIYEKLNGPYGGGSKVYEGKNGILFQRLFEDDDLAILFRSVDGGATWKKMPTPAARQVYDPFTVAYNGNLYGAAGKNLYVSVNDGQSWSGLNSPTAEAIVNVNALQNGVLLVSDYEKVYRSINNGQSWTAVLQTDIDAFYYNSYSDQVYAIGNQNIYVSNDGGLNWLPFYFDDFGDGSKEIISTSNGLVLVSGKGQIWKFDQSGNLIRTIGVSAVDDAYVEMAVSKAGRLFAFEKYAAYYSDDYGDNFLPLFPNPIPNKYIRTFSATTNGAVFGLPYSGSLYRSDNNGASWSFSAQGIDFATPLEVDFISESKILALTVDGLFYSEDGGLVWNSLLFGEFDFEYASKFERIQVIDKDYYFLNNDGIYYYSDVNASGKKIKNSKYAVGNKIYLNHVNNTLFFLENEKLYRSSDQGKTWVAILGAEGIDLKIFPDGSLLLLGRDGVFRSIDQGLNWSFVFPGGDLIANQILSDGFSTVFMFYPDPFGSGLFRSNDQGITWEKVDLLNGNGNLLFNANTGQACNNIASLFSASLTGEVYTSTNQGATFNVYLDLKYDLNALTISPAQKLYMLTIKNGLYRTRITTSSTKLLTGNVFDDANKNCLKDNGETILPKRIVKVENGSKINYAYTDAYGNFKFPIEQGDYQFSVPSSNSYWNSCIKSISASSYNLNDTLYLGLQALSKCPFMEVDIQTPFLRRCFESDIYVYYKNSGTIAAKDAYIDVTLDTNFIFVSSGKPVASINGNVYRFLIGDLEENNSGAFTIRIKVSCDTKLGDFHCAEAHIYPDTTCNQTAFADIKTTAFCFGDSIQLSISNLGNAAMLSPKKWIAIDQSISNFKASTIASGQFLLDAGQKFNVKIASASRVLFIAEQDDSNPYKQASRTEIVSCSVIPVPGAPVSRIDNLDEGEPFISKFCLQVRGSFDPNDITGFPIGISDRKYIDNEQELEYVIRFQNTGTDTAFNVRIANQIPINNLDLNTISLGSSSHPYQLLIDPTGKLNFSFQNILLPDSAINEKASHGFVSYRIKPIQKQGNGKKIENEAFIYFDFNDAVKTNREFHTLGIPIQVNSQNHISNSELKWSIQPNPLSQNAVIHLMNWDENEKYFLSCQDLNKKTMWTKPFLTNTLQIGRENLVPGFYFIILKNSKQQVIGVEKLIIK